MNETTQPSASDKETKNAEGERTKQIKVAGWTAGVSAFFAVSALVVGPTTWPVAIGVAAIAAMITTVCYFILKK